MFRRKRNTYMLFFASYAMVLLVTISSLAVYYSQISRQFFDDTRQQRTALLNQLEDNIDSKLKYADALLNSTMADSSLAQVTGGFAPLTDLMDKMHNAYQPDYLLNFAIYFPGSDEVVTQGVHMNTEDYFTYMYRITGMSFAAFRAEYLGKYAARALMQPVKVQLFERSPQLVLPYVQSYPVDSGKTEQAKMLVFLDTSDTTDLITQLGSSTHSRVYILNSENQVVLSSGKAAAPSAQLIAALKKNGATQFRIGGGKQVVSQAVSSRNGWRYVLVTPQTAYLWSNKQITVSWLAIFGVYLVIGFLIAHFLAKRSCKPIYEINEVIRTHQKGGPAVSEPNEFLHIRNTLIRQYDIDRDLNAVIQDQLPIVRQAFLNSIVRGVETHYDEAMKRFPSLGIRLISQQFVIAVFDFDTESPFFLENERSEDENLSLARSMIGDEEKSRIAAGQLCFLLDLDRNLYALLINLAEKADPNEAAAGMRQRLDDLGEQLSECFRLVVRFGVGNVHRKLAGLPECLAEARKALQAGRWRENGGTVLFDEVENAGPSYYFPTDTEYLLVRNLQDGNYHDARELIGNIFAINRHLVQGEAATDAFLDVVCFALVRVMNGTLKSRCRPPEPADSLRGRMGPHPTLEEARTVLLQYVDRIADARQLRTVSKTELLVNRIAAYLDESATSDLPDLNSVAARFHVTPQYVSNIFTKYRHEHIKDYISRLKLKQAKEYLTNTRLSLHDISVQMGYADEMGIFRLFHKYENMTPGEYRSQNQG